LQQKGVHHSDVEILQSFNNNEIARLIGGVKA
jgi:hypothetical protein